jgi:adenylate cyclase
VEPSSNKGRSVQRPLTIAQVAHHAGVDESYVHRLIDLGALDSHEHGYKESHAHLVALLHMWEEGGLSIESILTAVAAGELSFDFLETPAWALPERLSATYREFAAEHEIPLQLLLAVHEAIGFAASGPGDRVGNDDVVMADLIRTLLGIGASEEEVRRLFRLYADNLRRLATAEADLYLAEVERRWRVAGVAEPELMRYGAEAGGRLMRPVASTLLSIYNRHRQHIWSEHSIGTAESVLERAGLYRRVSRTPAICFVDLTGYTRLTEEQGDEAAARLAGNLASLIEDISQRHQGRSIRWLGDGGMFHFREPTTAFLAALEIVEKAPVRGLPPTHIGIEVGPVIARDGDVYGRTVNVAARIAALAQAGEILTSEEAAQQVESSDIRLERVGPSS